MELTEAQVLRVNILESVTLVVTNDDVPHTRIIEAVDCLAAWEHCDGGAECPEDTTDEHEDACPTMAGWPTVREVGDAVVDTLRDIITDELREGSVVHHILMGLLDLGEAGLIEMFGDHFYPSDAEISLRKAGMWEGKLR